ncbi:MAG: SprT-like domain-containing protein [Kiritimatiellia bacterium]
MKNDGQQELFPAQAHSRESLAQFLNNGASMPVEVAITSNRHNMLSIRFHPGRISVRMHEAFLNAPQDILQSLKDWLKTRRRERWSPVAEFAKGIQIREALPAHVRTAGEVYNLKELFREVSLEFFGGKPKCQISWGRAGRCRRRAKIRTVRWGTYDTRSKLIRVNPRLDSKTVPRSFVKYIIYHELLHECIPAERRNGRNAHHHATFKIMDRKFPDWPQMQEISAQLLKNLK